MAWSVDANTMAVTMHKGDTGAYWVDLTLEDDEGNTESFHGTAIACNCVDDYPASGCGHQ